MYLFASSAGYLNWRREIRTEYCFTKHFGEIQPNIALLVSEQQITIQGEETWEDNQNEVISYGPEFCVIYKEYLFQYYSAFSLITYFHSFYIYCSL